MAKKGTKIDKAFRINRIVRMISNGAVNSEIVDYCRQEWGLSRCSAYKYIAWSREEIVSDINQDRQVVVAELIHGAHTVWKKAVADKQYNNALGAMNLISRLGGLEPK